MECTVNNHNHNHNHNQSTIKHTAHNRTDVSSMYSYVDVGHSVDHEIENVLPVIITSVSNAAGMIDNETNIQQTA